MTTSYHRVLFFAACAATAACGSTYKLTLGTSAFGTVTASPAGPTYAAKTKVTLTAAPASGYALTAWNGSDDDSVTALTNTVTMTADRTVSATFTATSTNLSYTLTLTAGANGSVVASPVTTTYAAGTVVTLTASPSAGYQVDTWTGADTEPSTSPINHVTMSADETVSVSFKLLPIGAKYHLTLPASIANGTLAASPTEPAGGYDAGTTVTLTASPAGGYTVGAWTGTDNNATTALTNQITMVADESVSVSFQAAGATTYALTLTHTGPGTVVVTSSVPSQPGPSYTAGTVVTLTATPATDYDITAWSLNTDTPSSTAVTNTVTMSGPEAVSVTFACTSNCHTLALHVDSGVSPDDYDEFGYIVATDSVASGQLAATSIGHGDASVAVPAGHTVDLVAHDSAVSSDWGLQTWTTATPGGNTCDATVVMSGDETVSATFPLGVAAHCP